MKRMTTMITAQLRRDSLQKSPMKSDAKQTSTEQFELLQDLDLRYLIENGQPILNAAELNNSEILAHDETIENISYSLGLLSYALGLFGIAYWTLVLPNALLLLGGLSAIAFGVKLFLSPIKFLNKKLQNNM